MHLVHSAMQKHVFFNVAVVPFHYLRCSQTSFLLQTILLLLFSLVDSARCL